MARVSFRSSSLVLSCPCLDALAVDVDQNSPASSSRASLSTAGNGFSNSPFPAFMRGPAVSWRVH
jgi:hypothetical protein